MVQRHGASSNPPNRFERLRLEAAPELGYGAGPDDPPEDPRTELLVDPSRTILATNESPDLGFAASVNPYRGCQHGCSYCLAPDTNVLLADLSSRPIGELKEGDALVGFDECPRPGRQARKLRVARVERAWWSRRPTWRLVTRGTEVVTTAEHRWLTGSSARWSCARHLAVGEPLLHFDGRSDAIGDPDELVAIEPGPARDVVDIQTSTGTFYANGLATHNCYARPTHEYLGYSAGLDFETKILVKARAPELLRRELSSPRWKPQVIALAGVTDAYQPAERRLRVTRGCLEVLASFRNPVAVVTKGFLVTRDADLLGELARFDAAAVMISVTTLDEELQRKLEPFASPPRKRLAAIELLARAGIPVGVLVAPVIPGLTDHELPAILAAAAKAGARSAGRVVLRLPHGVKEVFGDWLAAHFPERKEKVLNRLRALHGGKLYDSTFGHRQRGAGEFAEQIDALFQLGLKRAGLERRSWSLSTAAFRVPGRSEQLGLFGSEA